jgi:hypothetical protein
MLGESPHEVSQFLTKQLLKASMSSFGRADPSSATPRIVAHKPWIPYSSIAISFYEERLGQLT